MPFVFNNFPDLIVKRIYEYDCTFHLIYKKVLAELNKKLSLWRIKWLNNNIDWGNTNEQNKYKITDFQSEKIKIKDLVYYWNYKYQINFNRWNISIPSNKIKKYNCEPEFITDNLNANKIIFDNLKFLKKWTIDNNNNLYKPGRIN